MMAEPKKPFACCIADCGMTFTNEDHLNIHTKKHDMILQLGLGHKAPTFVADQTPTPTRFIRNCEEVGLFQDLQNVNPFDETFKRAMDTKASIMLSLDGTLPGILSDDALHTPNIFSHLPEDSPTANFKASQGATDLRTNLSINRSSSDESAVIVKSICSQNDKTLDSEILTTSKLVETKSLRLHEEESSKVTIIRQDSLELAQSVLDSNIRKETELLNNVEVKFQSNFEIRQTLQNSSTDNVIDDIHQTNLSNIDKSIQIPLISITDSSPNEFPNKNQENMKCNVIEKDVMLSTSKSELNLTNHIKKNCVELISQKSLDMAIDSLTSGCLKRIDSIEENKSISYLERNNKSMESNNLLSKMKSNLQSVLHNAIEKHALDKTRNNLSKANKQNVAGSRNASKNKRMFENILKRRNSESSDDSSKCKGKKHRDSDSEYEITLKLPNGKKVWMKSVDMTREENAGTPDVTASHPIESVPSIDYTDMSNTKQKLKDAINIRKGHIDNLERSLRIARDKTALNELYANASKGLFPGNIDATRKQISTVSCTTIQPNENSQRAYVLPGNIIPVTESASHIPSQTNIQQPTMASPHNTNQSTSSNTSNRNIIVISNTQIAAKLSANTLLPHIITNTNTILPINKPPTLSSNTITQSTSANNIIGNVFLIKTASNLDSDTKLSPHNVTKTNTVLPSNKPSTIQSTSSNNLPGNVIFIDDKQMTTKFDTNQQLPPNIMTYTNNVIKCNKLATNLIDNGNELRSSNNVAQNVIFINAKQSPMKLGANTQLTPHIVNYKNTVIPSINPPDRIAKPIIPLRSITSNEKCKVAIPSNKEHNIIKEKTPRTKGPPQKPSRQERQNAAVQRYRKRQSELKLTLTKKNFELKAQNEKLTRDLTMAHQEIAQLRGLLETHKNCSSYTTGAPKQPVQLQHRYILVGPEIVQTHSENPCQSINMNNNQIKLMSSGNKDIDITEAIIIKHTETRENTHS